MSTGEPDGKWKPWVKWIVLILMSLAAAWTAESCEQNTGVTLAWSAGLVAWLWRFHITAQRFELMIDQHAVQVDLRTDGLRRVWISWKSQGAAGRSRIGTHQGSEWVDYAIPLAGQAYQLRIFIKPYGGGYMISNYGRGFGMSVLRHTHAF